MKPLRIVVFSGTSGGGKTTALHAVEDLGFYCVDNLPLPLLDSLIETLQQDSDVDRLALVVDVRLKQYVAGYIEALEHLRMLGHSVEIVYLDAVEDVLIRRFSQTRRRHPLSTDDLPAGLRLESQILEPMRARANFSIDTSEMTVHDLKLLIQARFMQASETLVVSVLSFGFRYGLPTHADLVLDVRFLPNPYFVDELRPLTGQDKAVSDYVLVQPDAREFLDKTNEWLRFLLPRYRGEGKVYLTIAVGCTGGRHRSPAIAEELARRLRGSQPISVHVRHRDVSR